MTIKDLIRYFKQFTDNHPILQTFSWGNLSDYSRDTFKTQYPALHIVPLPSTLDKNSTQMSFNVLIYDLLNEYVGDPINSNQLDSMSLTQEILSDFLNEFINELTDYGYYLETPVQFSPFVDRFAESVCGVEATITITIEQNACIPANILPQPILPTSINGLFAWYDLQDQDTLTLSGNSRVIQLDDKSGNDYHLTPFSSTTPVYSASTKTNTYGKYALWYDENKQGLIHSLSSPQLITGGTMLLVYGIPQDNPARGLFSLISGSTNSFAISALGFGKIGEDLTLFPSIAAREIEAVPRDDFDDVIDWGIAYSNTLNDFKGAELGKLNQVVNFVSGGTSIQNDGNIDHIILGDTTFLTPLPTSFPFPIYEAIAYNRPLTDDELEGVLTYLKDKYNQPYWI